MNLSIAILGMVVAVAAAVRSTWSPCGQSMLSTITPLGEQRRGARFRWTASWFVVGAVGGGLTLGGVAMALAAGVDALDPSRESVALVAALLAAVTVTSDLRIGGFRLPWHHRQVNELWLDRYRPWLYGAGFGWQIGTGVVTYIMTAAVYLLVGLAALSASPLLALAVCTLFGFVRGLAVLLGARLTTPAALRAFHRRFDDLEPAGRHLVVGAQIVTLSVALGIATTSLAPAALVAVVGAAFLAWRARVGSATVTDSV